MSDHYEKFKVGDVVYIERLGSISTVITVAISLAKNKREYYITDDGYSHWSNQIKLAPETAESVQEEFDRLAAEFNESASETQISGNHYKDLKIQPMEYALANKLDLAQGNVVKYVTRFRAKNGIEDLRKAIHCIELLIEFEEKK